jgi:hypothetical protein
MPNLENLKKQAKLYLRWHRDRHYPVAARIRAVLPRFRHLSDREVLAHSFKLSDAQELIARKAGFESWAALRKAAEVGVSAHDGTASVDLGVDSGAVWAVHDQHALRIHGPFGGAARVGGLPHHAAGDR